MTATRSGPSELATSIGREVRNLVGMVRRMAVTLTSGPLWQVVGHMLLDGRKEAREAEAFTGVGFYARPKDGNRVDAIIFFPDGAAFPVTIATRDLDTWKKAASDLAANESQMHNDLAVLRIKADGTIEARSIGGTAHRIPTLAEVQAMVAQYNVHTHTGNGANPPAQQMANPSGTTKFRAE